MRLWIIPVVIVITIGFVYFSFFQAAPSPLGLHYASHSQRDFYPTLTADTKVPIVPNVKGAIVSHHLYAETDIAKLFLAMRDQKPSVVVIVGPNHFTAGINNIQVSRYAYETPWGRLDPHQETIDSLIKSGDIFQEERSFEREHSISALVTFVKYAFPDTKFVPIIVKRDTPIASMEGLAQTLNNILPNDALVIASVDFSHHGNRFMAQFHDDKSIGTIQSFDFDNISKLEIDSPSSIYALLKYLELRGAQKIVNTRTDSAKIGNNPLSEDVTSYLFAHFSEGPIETKPTISTLHFGDIMVDRSVRPKIAQGLNPFKNITGVEGNFFRGMDWILANLEGPITETGDCQKKEIVFSFPLSTVTLLKSNNITVVNLANNHSYDCKAVGLADTKKYLKEGGVDFFGTIFGDSDVVTKKVQGETIAFLGADLISPSTARFQAFLASITEAQQNHDYVIVHVHWGNEYQKLPSADQQKMGRQIIDAGADVVIGHHPHVIEPAEIYKGKAIFYSLGNFVFDQYMPGTKEGVGVGVIQQDDLMRFTVFPFDIIEYQPQLKSIDKALEICAFVLKDIPKRDGCSFEVSSVR